MRVLVVDDHEMFREGVRQALSASGQIEVVGEVGDGRAAVTAVGRCRPDVVLMDIRMPVMDGIEATRRIKQQFPAVRVLILTVSDLERDLFEAIKAGADGYLLKNVGGPELVGALLATGAGESPLSPVMAAHLLRECRNQQSAPVRDSVHQLTTREVEVLQLASQGLTYKEIAGRLFVAESTVKNHMRNIMEKLHLRNRSEAVSYAYRQGLVDETETEEQG